MSDFFHDAPLGILLLTLGKTLLLLVPLLIGVAYLTYAERKVLGAMQLRQGPMVVGPFGLLQPIADGLKLLSKETIVPLGANKGVFIVAPMLTFMLALVAWAVIPVNDGVNHPSDTPNRKGSSIVGYLRYTEADESDKEQ